jgi:UDP-glucose 4-epimerase
MIPGTLTIIGGAGFLGRSLVSRLAADDAWRDVEIRCLDRVAYPEDAPRPAKFREIVGDAHDPDVRRDALDGADAVHIRAAILGGAASIDPQRIGDYLDVNVDLVARVLDMCDQVGCKRVLFDSSEQVFGDPADHQSQSTEAEPVAGNYYGAGKLIAEKLLHMWSAADATRSVQIMRYSRVRAGQTRDVVRVMIDRALGGQPLRIMGNSTRRIAFVHIDDVLDVNVAALNRSPRYALYHVGADRCVSLFELADRIRAAARAVTGADSVIEVGAGAAPFEPHVVGMQWEASRRELALAPPRGLDDMFAETITELTANRV